MQILLNLFFHYLFHNKLNYDCRQLLFLWNFFEVPYLWTFVVYFTVFHNVRQLYGINKWFQLVEKNFNKVPDYFLYAVCGASFLALHLRTDFPVSDEKWNRHLCFQMSVG